MARKSRVVGRLADSSVMAVDRHDRPVILFESEWALRYFERHHPDVVLMSESPVTAAKPGRM